MKILLDHNIDWRIKRLLPDHEVHTTKEMGWERLTNGQLLTNVSNRALAYEWSEVYWKLVGSLSEPDSG